MNLEDRASRHEGFLDQEGGTAYFCVWAKRTGLDAQLTAAFAKAAGGQDWIERRLLAFKDAIQVDAAALGLGTRTRFVAEGELYLEAGQLILRLGPERE